MGTLHTQATQMLFYIFPLFLFCAVVFTIYLLAITVREARSVVARQLSEPEKDAMQIRQVQRKMIPTIGSCEPDQPDEPGKSEQSAEETAELRQQVNKTYLMGIGSFVLKRKKRENTILLRLNFDRWWKI